MKLKEFFDQVGWTISLGGNKTRVKKSFYLKNKRKYISPWFVKEEDATEWQNDKVFHRNPQSTLTLYEITKDIHVDKLSKLEGKIRNILSVALESKEIKQSDIQEFVEPVFEIKGEKAKKDFYKILEKYKIKVINEEQLNEDNLTVCPKCGSEQLTSGIRNKDGSKIDVEKLKKMSREEKGKVFNSSWWFHECLKCGHLIPLNKKAQFEEDYNYGELKVQENKKKKKSGFSLYGYFHDYDEDDYNGNNDIDGDGGIDEMSTGGAVAGFNGPLVDTSGMRFPGKKKRNK